MARTLVFHGYTSPRYDTAGGCPALMHEDDLEQWKAEHDYALTFERNDFLWSLHHRGKPTLVFGDPASIWLQHAEGVEAVLIQWMHGPRGYALPASITLTESLAQAPVHWTGRGDFWLFDPALDGPLSVELGEGISITLRSCRCVETYEYRPTKEVWMIVHVFIGAEEGTAVPTEVTS